MTSSSAVKTLLCSVAVAAILLQPTSAQPHQMAERLRGSADVYQQLWDAAEAKPKSMEAIEEDERAKRQEELDMLELLDAGFSLELPTITEPPSSDVPSDYPSLMPSTIPSDGPSLTPTEAPSDEPTMQASAAPTVSSQPTFEFWPSFSPSISLLPSSGPTLSAQPSGGPTVSAFPSDAPSLSVMPSSSPSISAAPSAAPSVSSAPSEDGATNAPSAFPSTAPTSFPTKAPTKAPTPAPVPATPSPTVSVLPSSFPTLANCPGFTPEKRIAEIIAQLRAVSDPFLILDLDTPQGLATDWLLNRDLGQTCPDDPKLIQRWTLAVMYFSTSGDTWSQCSAVGSDACGDENPFRGDTRFLSGGTECEWAGINCNLEGCVTEVEFEDNGLIGTIPTEMALLTDLAVWGMEQGGLASTIPTEVGTMSNLVFMDFDFNELTGSLPRELFSLTKLNQLDLNNNQLTGNVEGIGALTDLTFLQLHINQFTGTIPESVGNLAQMRTFTLYDTFFSGTMPQSVCLLRNTTGGLLRSLVAECDDVPGLGRQIVCETPECCSDCRGLPPGNQGV